MQQTENKSYTITLPNNKEGDSIKYTSDQLDALAYFGSRLHDQNSLISRISLSIAMREYCKGNSLFSSAGSITRPCMPFAVEVICFIALMIGTGSVSFTLMAATFGALSLFVFIKVGNTHNFFDANNGYIAQLASHWIDNSDYYKGKHTGKKNEGYDPDYDEMSRYILAFIEGKPMESRGKLMYALYHLFNDINIVKQAEINEDKAQRFNKLMSKLNEQESNTEQST